MLEETLASRTATPASASGEQALPRGYDEGTLYGAVLVAVAGCRLRPRQNWGQRSFMQAGVVYRGRIGRKWGRRKETFPISNCLLCDF
jgi:hypothetical protein